MLYGHSQQFHDHVKEFGRNGAQAMEPLTIGGALIMENLLPDCITWASKSSPMCTCGGLDWPSALVLTLQKLDVVPPGVIDIAVFAFILVQGWQWCNVLCGTVAQCCHMSEEMLLQNLEKGKVPFSWPIMHDYVGVLQCQHGMAVSQLYWAGRGFSGWSSPTLASLCSNGC